MTSGAAESIPTNLSTIDPAVRSLAHPLRLSALEIASGTVLGSGVSPLDNSSVGGNPGSPLAALEAAVLPALLRPPCLVSFSGGMDSSFVLAVAAKAARRHGLADPIPITWRFTDAPKAEESPWQETVLKELRIGERLLLRANDELDFVGPIAAAVLRRYGLLFPANLHLHQPILDQAPGGSLLTGVGGDQVLTSWAGPRQVGRRRVRSRLPYSLRLRVQQHRGRAPYPWLRREVARDLLRRRRELQRAPATGSARVRRQTSSRDLLMCCQNLGMLGRDADVQIVSPLLNAGFHAALGSLIGDRRDIDRAGVLAAIAGDDLPPATYAYRPKAHFSEVFLRRYTRQFQANWNGGGVVESLVDPAALRSVWSPHSSNTSTALLLQQVWLNQLQPA